MATKKTTSATKKEIMQADVYTPEGKNAGKVTLDGRIFGMPENKSLIAQAVRIYLANKRSGTHDAKTRSEVSGTTKKIYKQKGTGRARHGDRKAPIFIGGGKAHGPKPRDYSLTLPKNMRRKALFSSLSSKLKDGGLKFVKGLPDMKPKTKNMAMVMKNLDIDKKGNSRSLLVADAKMESLVRASKNIPDLDTIPFQLLNAYEVVAHKSIIFAEDVLESFQKLFIGGKSTGNVENDTEEKMEVKKARRNSGGDKK